MAATPADRFADEIRALTASIDRLPDAAVADMLALLERARLAVRGQLAAVDPGTYALYRLTGLEAGLTDVMARFAQQYETAMDPAQAAAWQAGTDLAADPLIAGGAMFHAPLPSRRMLEAARAYHASLITGLAGDAVSTISETLRRGIVQGRSVFEVAQDVTSSLDDASTFGSLAVRAETITRTELGRIQSIANQATLAEAKPFVEDLQKQWMHSGNSGKWRREGHVEAEGQLREPDAPYNVRPRYDRPFEALLYPRDPAGSAASTINCGCLSLPYRAAWAGALAEAA